jgi:translation initiation factor IF-2
VVASEEKKSRGDPAEEAITTIKKLSGTKLTGQTIDLSQFNKPKRKKEELLHKPGSAGAAGAANKNKRKRLSLNRVPRPPEFLVHLILIRLVVVVLMP